MHRFTTTSRCGELFLRFAWTFDTPRVLSLVVVALCVSQVIVLLHECSMFVRKKMDALVDSRYHTNINTSIFIGTSQLQHLGYNNCCSMYNCSGLFFYSTFVSLRTQRERLSHTHMQTLATAAAACSAAAAAAAAAEHRTRPKLQPNSCHAQTQQYDTTII